jgi:hypothetical protein
MNIDTLLYILAAVCFGLDAAKVASAINWTAAGFCLLTIALFLV